MCRHLFYNLLDALWPSHPRRPMRSSRPAGRQRVTQRPRHLTTVLALGGGDLPRSSPEIRAQPRRRHPTPHLGTGPFGLAKSFSAIRPAQRRKMHRRRLARRSSWASCVSEFEKGRESKDSRVSRNPGSARPSAKCNDQVEEPRINLTKHPHGDLLQEASSIHS